MDKKISSSREKHLPSFPRGKDEAERHPLSNPFLHAQAIDISGNCYVQPSRPSRAPGAAWVIRAISYALERMGSRGSTYFVSIRDVFCARRSKDSMNDDSSRQIARRRMGVVAPSLPVQFLLMALLYMMCVWFWECLRSVFVDTSTIQCTNTHTHI